MTKQQENDIKTLVKDVVRQCLSDKNFMDVFADNLSDLVTKTISEQFTKVEEEFSMFKSEVSHLQGEIEMFKQKNDDLSSRLSRLEGACTSSDIGNRNTEIFNKVMRLEQMNKSHQIRILGFPESIEDNLKSDLENFFKNTLLINSTSIEYCTRLGTFENNKIRPVVVSFGNMQERNNVFYNKKKTERKKNYH